MRIELRFDNNLPARDVQSVLGDFWRYYISGDDERLQGVEGFPPSLRVSVSPAENNHEATMVVSRLSGTEVSPSLLWACVLTAHSIARHELFRLTEHDLKVSLSTVPFPIRSSASEFFGGIQQPAIVISPRVGDEPEIDWTPVQCETMVFNTSSDYIDPRYAPGQMFYQRLAQVARRIDRPVGAFLYSGNRELAASTARERLEALRMILGEQAYVLSTMEAPSLYGASELSWVDASELIPAHEEWHNVGYASAGNPYYQPQSLRGTQWDAVRAPYNSIITHFTAARLNLPPGEFTLADVEDYGPLAGYGQAVGSPHLVTSMGYQDRFPIAYIFRDLAVIPHVMALRTDIGDQRMSEDYARNLTIYLDEIFEPIEALNSYLQRDMESYNAIIEAFKASAEERVKRRRLEALRRDFDQLYRAASVRARAELESAKSDMAGFYRQYLLKNEQVRRLMAVVDAAERGEGSAAMLTRLEHLLESPKIADISIAENGRYIAVRTGVLCAEDDRSGCWHRMGTYEIKIDTTNSDVIRFFNDNTGVRGWGDGMQHPHVFSDGNACAGSHEEVFLDLTREREWPGLIVACIQFLEHANTDDSAGQYINRWPVEHEPWLYGYDVDPDSYRAYPYDPASEEEEDGEE